MKVGNRSVPASVTSIKYQVNVNSLEHIAARKLELNEIGVCNVNLDRPIAFDPYAENPDTGGFILIDRHTNNTVGAGLANFALRRSQNIHMQHMDVNKAASRSAKQQHKTQENTTELTYLKRNYDNSFTVKKNK